jgi:hypothetical protein
MMKVPAYFAPHRHGAPALIVDKYQLDLLRSGRPNPPMD